MNITLPRNDNQEKLLEGEWEWDGEWMHRWKEKHNRILNPIVYCSLIEAVNLARENKWGSPIRIFGNFVPVWRIIIDFDLVEAVVGNRKSMMAHLPADDIRKGQYEKSEAIQFWKRVGYFFF